MVDDRERRADGATVDERAELVELGVEIARDAAGNRYALTMINWRGSDGREVVLVAPGESAETAPIIGQLAAVVVAWLDGKKP